MEFYPETPAILWHCDPRKPLCNGGGKPKAPKPAPAPIAPVRVDEEAGSEQALAAMRRRKGLKRTILASQLQDNLAPEVTQMLGQTTALGAAIQPKMEIK